MLLNRAIALRAPCSGAPRRVCKRRYTPRVRGAGEIEAQAPPGGGARFEAAARLYCGTSRQPTRRTVVLVWDMLAAFVGVVPFDSVTTALIVPPVLTPDPPPPPLPPRLISVKPAISAPTFWVPATLLVAPETGAPEA